MSNFLEEAGRKITGSLTPDTSSSPAQTERGKALIRQLVTGGLQLGGGVGLGAALANLLSSLSKEKELYDPSELNADTLYIPIKGEEDGELKKKADALPYLAPGIALAGGAASGLLGYAAVQQIWERIQKARRKKLLDEAQNEAIAASDLEAKLSKSAADAKFNLSDTVLGVPVATALLAALASGGVTMAALNKAFPTITSPKSNRPKRVRLVEENGEQIEVPDEVVKEAAFGDFEAAGREFTAGLASRMRPQGLTRAILNLVAHRGVDSLSSTVKSAGVASLPDAVKGWADRNVSARDLTLASMALHKNAYMSEVAHTVAVQELLDAAPRVISSAIGDGDPDRMKKAADLASILGLAARKQYLPEFDTEEVPSVNASPHDYQRALEGESSAQEEADAGLNSDSGGMLSDSEDDSDKQEDVDNDDHVDELMTGARKMSVA